MNTAEPAAQRTALVAGGSGMVGGYLLEALLASPAYARVISLTRRPRPQPQTQPPGKLVEIAANLLDLAPLGERLAADDVFCCLGTTTAKAGREGLEQVDHDMVVEFARAGRAAGARQFVVVSAIGTSATAPSFYARVKARMEQDVAALGYPAVHILRPSLLMGPRGESRPAERFAQVVAPLLAPLMIGPLRPYRPVDAAQVAQAMLRLALAPAQGMHIHYFRE
ncbi:MAG: NAD(P)H-binding protein [Nevskia sp.]|nr:NAD(P)H-binding protein [Nevskia sp.]